MVKYYIRANRTPNKRFIKQNSELQYKLSFKTQIKVIFTAISKTKRARMMTFCMQAHLTPTKRVKKEKKMGFN